MRVLMRYPGGRAKALTYSYDDGVDQDIHLIEILNKYNMKGTFKICQVIFSKGVIPFKKSSQILITCLTIFSTLYLIK